MMVKQLVVNKLLDCIILQPAHEQNYIHTKNIIHTNTKHDYFTCVPLPVCLYLCAFTCVPLPVCLYLCAWGIIVESSLVSPPLNTN